MGNFILIQALLIFLALSTPMAQAADEQFSLLSRDGVQLSGQIDFPLNSFVKGAVLLVPGTGLFNRDAEFGKTNTEKDLIFRQISKSLTARGFAIIRFDYRGVKCSRRTMPPCPECRNNTDRNSHFIKSCLDNDIRAGVTPENIREDIEIIYKYIQSHSKLKSKKIIVFGHSEGSLNLSHLIRDNRIDPHAALFMGGLAESPQSVVHWQMTERPATALAEFDFDKDGLIENDEIKAGHEKKLNYLYQLPVESLLSTRGSWTKDSFLQSQEQTYKEVQREALSHADHEAFGVNGVNQASYRWWKMFFSDSRSTAENMIHFKGKTVYLNGDIDVQTNFQRQADEIQRLAAGFLVPPELIKVQGTGHGLGSDPIFGPLLPSSLALIVNQCERLIR